jgi:hypothetical protein
METVQKYMPAKSDMIITPDSNRSQRKVAVGELLLPVREIERGLGYKDSVPEALLQEITAALKIAQKLIDAQIGYVRFAGEQFRMDKNSFHIKGVQFDCGKIIARQLQKSEACVLFACTIGQRFDEWIRELFRKEETMAGFIADTIGSIAVEAAADIMEKDLTRLAEMGGQKLSNRLSPGYCGWNVEEQHKLFSFLPQRFSGVELNSSAQMRPIKSVSGIIGIGREVTRQSVTCKICGEENCYMRREERDRAYEG